MINDVKFLLARARVDRARSRFCAAEDPPTYTLMAVRDGGKPYWLADINPFMFMHAPPGVLVELTEEDAYTWASKLVSSAPPDLVGVHVLPTYQAYKLALKSYQSSLARIRASRHP